MLKGLLRALNGLIEVVIFFMIIVPSSIISLKMHSYIYVFVLSWKHNFLCDEKNFGYYNRCWLDFDQNLIPSLILVAKCLFLLPHWWKEPPYVEGKLALLQIMEYGKLALLQIMANHTCIRYLAHEFFLNLILMSILIW